MIEQLDQLDDLGAALFRRADEAGAYLIWRAQARSVSRIVVRDGRTEGATASSSIGHGVHVIGASGFAALGSRDDLLPEAALDVLERTVAAADCAGHPGSIPVSVPQLEVTRARCVPREVKEFSAIDLPSIGQRLVELESEIHSRVDGTRLLTSFRAEIDAWRVARSDGAVALFAMPRCSLGARATAVGPKSQHAVSVQVFGTSPRLLTDEAACSLFLRRAEQAARLARELPDAPRHPSGSFPIVIDYALAKGLAHEAFGHAAEADGFRSSVLARDGRFRCGERVGDDRVRVIDEPIERDHAWQPFSANAVPRRRATIVDRGRLHEGLADIWSAESGGVPITGAARAESFRNAPLPRMSNIRIEIDEPRPAPGRFEDYGPSEVRNLLGEAGILDRYPRVAFLSGYTGGQVNPVTGDFVFNCKAIYGIEAGRVTLYRPAIFSGSMFGALAAIREAFGPLQLDALGYCGKWGQSVPSSGGSHYFLFLEPDPTVRLGGD